MNKVILMGRLTAEPELRQTQSGISVCRFNLAVNRRFKEKDTGEVKADFISCVAWKQTAEFICRYFHKGSMICVEGTLRTGSYQDKNYQDVKHYTTDVYVENVEFTGEKQEQQQAQQAYQQQYQQPPQPPQNYQQAYQPQQAYDREVAEFQEILDDEEVPF